MTKEAFDETTKEEIFQKLDKIRKKSIEDMGNIFEAIKKINNGKLNKELYYLFLQIANHREFIHYEYDWIYQRDPNGAYGLTDCWMGGCYPKLEDPEKYFQENQEIDMNTLGQNPNAKKYF